MIITKTPLRISLCGGATDLPEFYLKHGGAVVSFAINKYIYISVNPKFDGGIRASYSITENVETAQQLKHDIIAMSLIEYGINSIEVVSISDIPGQGSGLGSSSSFAVGLDVALRKYNGISLNHHPSTFAESAYRTERELCEHPVGKQDHYAAAYGGLRFYLFNKDDTVIVNPIYLRTDKLFHLESNLLLFWTGATRHADRILTDQGNRLREDPAVGNFAIQMKYNAISLFNSLNHNDISEVGEFLHANWMLKKELALGISTKVIDDYYFKAMEAGASGGKLCGAGGSGFLLFYAEKNKHSDIEKALGLRRVMFKIANEGSKVIYEDTP